MAGEMITSLKALLSPQMAKYVGSSCSQQLRGTGARGKRAGGGQPGLGPQAPGPALCPGLVGVGWLWRRPARLDQQGCVPGLLASASPQPSPPPPPQPGTFMPNGARKPDLEPQPQSLHSLSPACGLGHTCSTPGRVPAHKPFVEEAAQPSERAGRGRGVRWERSPYPPSPVLSPAPTSCLPTHPSRDAK